jgi:hypothetical protein
VLPGEGRAATSASFHVLVACAPGENAPAGQRWISPAALSEASPFAAPWLLAAAEALSAVRELPAPASREPRGSAPGRRGMAQLLRDAEEANSLLRAHCEQTPGPAWQPDLFRSWG